MITDDLKILPANSPRYYSTINIAHGARQEVCVTLCDRLGNPLNLSEMSVVRESACKTQDCAEGPDAENPGFEDQIHPKTPDWPDVEVWLAAVSYYGADTHLFQVQGKIVDAANGRVVFHLTQNQSKTPGMFIGDAGLYRGENLMQRWPFYINIEPNAFFLSDYDNNNGVITVPEIRLSMRDCAGDNFLLDEPEFRDVEIMHCIRKPVDYWNEILPPGPELMYEYQFFPFRYHWLRATCGHLLEIAAHWYRRNELPVNAGGIAINDRGKWQQYDAKAKELIDEYREFAKQRKAAISMGHAFGGVTSPFGRLTPRGSGYPPRGY